MCKGLWGTSSCGIVKITLKLERQNMTSSSLMTLTPFKELGAVTHSSHCHHLKLFHQWNCENPILTSSWYFTVLILQNRLTVTHPFIFLQIWPVSLSLMISYLNCFLSSIFHPPSSFYYTFPNPINLQNWISQQEKMAQSYKFLLLTKSSFQSQCSP